jgi:succinate-semialdehyde dehydrogenase / glutarate-semialdehyde dehydrogenase
VQLIFVDGAWREGRRGAGDIVNPATEEVIGTVSLADLQDLDEAIEAAARGGAIWRRVPPLERGALLARAAALLRERIPDAARDLTAEQGKTLTEATVELSRAAETLAWNGEEAGRINGRGLASRAEGTQRALVPAPVGVVAAFTPWNFPAALVARKLGPALAAGCPVILKAAEETPRTAATIVRALEEAGLPAGVVNLVFGDPPEISKHLLGSPVVRKLTFTGSTAVGRTLAALAAADLKRCTFELGGHASVIVAEDADVEHAVTETLKTKFGAAGQSCIAPSRFYVHAGHYEEFTERFVERARALRLGDGLEEDVDMGPMAKPERLAAMERLTEDARARGATMLHGGSRLPRRGWFWEPTVIGDVPDEALVMNEEPFGPIAPMSSFDTLEEALARANRLPYGFASYVFTNSLETGAAAVSELEAGNIGINQMAPALPDAPVGGFGDSGYGYEGGREGVEAFLHLKLVSQTVLERRGGST